MTTLRRFSLYGFLKNQQYYDYSLVLAFLQMGLSYTQIGLLVGFREAVVAALEIPSGVLADRAGRRRAMVLSLTAYALSFAAFGGLGLGATRGALGGGALYASLFGAMTLFAVGDAFRSGTHKAMIFAWLRAHGREGERTRVYGFTRSWSKLGSAVSTVVACGVIWATGDYVVVFLAAILPYLLNIVNVATYPPEVESPARAAAGPLRLGGLGRELLSALTDAARSAPLRRVLGEAMAFESYFKVAKDYLQPILLTGAVALTATWLPLAGATDAQRSVVLLGPVYVGLFLLAALASRRAHRLVARAGGSAARAARWLWAALGLTCALVLTSLLAGWLVATVLGFAALYVLQNLWRTILMSRLDAVSEEARGATVLSIESQLKSLGVLVLAPTLGALVDLARATGADGATGAPPPAGYWPYWPVALAGALVALAFVATGRRSRG